ncbi:MAG: NUDIX domain-containing protein [Candidatus Aenigmatarchaeota archaeon]
MEEIATFASCSVRGFITKGNKVLLVKEKGEETWETPGGRMHKTDKNPVEACEREVLEETGYKADVQKVLDVCTHMFEDGRRVFHIIYECGLKEKVKEPDPDITGIKWFSKSEIKELLKQGKADFHDKGVFDMFVK